jgi:predicted methyltransferase
MKSTLLACLFALPAVIAAAPAPAPAPPPVDPALHAAVADPRRPQADTQRDAERKPAESMAFAGVKPGMTVIELMPGGGYYTRLLSAAVGPQGHVYEFVGAPRPDTPPGSPDRTLPIKAIMAEPGYGNITLLVQPIKDLALPTGADLVWTSNNYHDVHNVPGIDLAAFNKAVFVALKPGGHYLIIDHAAGDQADADVTSTLHRIPAASVIVEVQAAGFVLEEQGYALHNPDDSHELKVFDPKIQGKTDQFMLRFRKPG